MTTLLAPACNGLDQGSKQSAFSINYVIDCNNIVNIKPQTQWAASKQAQKNRETNNEDNFIVEVAEKTKKMNSNPLRKGKLMTTTLL